MMDSTATRDITLITSQTNITLNSGWNLISLSMRQGDSGTDRNISLASGWNLIGYSSTVPINLSDTKFIAADDGTVYTWANAVSNNKLQAYLAYYDSSGAAGTRKYKYVASSGVDSSQLEHLKGYWILTNEAGNLSLPGVGGSYSNATYEYSRLRFSNGTMEVNVSQAISNGWVMGGSGAQTYMNYWDSGDWKRLDDNPILAHKSTLSPWEGYFIWSNYDNITLMRQN